MARKKKTETKRPIESYEHRGKERLNNPPVGLVTPDTDPDAGQKKKKYAYDPHLDPQLVWAGEGINLQFCRYLINWDIPWNPNRLEQRSQWMDLRG